MRRLIALFPLVLLAAGCAGSISMAPPSADPGPAQCSDLAWDDCGRAIGCRHGRSFDAAGTESFTCVARYADLVSVLAMPGVQSPSVSLRTSAAEGASIAQP